MTGVAFAILGFVVLCIGLAVYWQVRHPDRRAQKRADQRSFLRAQSVANRRIALEPLNPNERHPYRAVLKHAPRDKR